MIDRCGLPVSPKKLSEAIIANRFESLTGRRPGEEKIDAHERKGIHGGYKNYFGEKVKQEFKRRYRDLLLKSGYERNHDW